MAFLLNCPACGRQCKAPANFAGRQVRCNTCGQEFRVPESSRSQHPKPPVPAVAPVERTPIRLDPLPIEEPIAGSHSYSTMRLAPPRETMDPDAARVLIAAIGAAIGAIVLVTVLIFFSKIPMGNVPGFADATSSEAESAENAATVSEPASSATPSTPAVRTTRSPTHVTVSNVSGTSAATSNVQISPSHVTETAESRPEAIPPAEDARPAFWLQDFNVAKQTAAEQGKDILLVFTRSDACRWSMRMDSEIFARDSFLEQAQRDFVLVTVDFPEGKEGQSQVEDISRNLRLLKQLGVQVIPSVVLSDAQGRPYGFQNYVVGGVSRFMELVQEHRAVRQTRDQALARIESAAGAEKLAPMRECLELLLKHDLLAWHEEHVKQWEQIATMYDGRNEHGVNEVFFEHRWIEQLNKLNDMSHESEFVRQAQMLDQWEQQCDFRDDDRGALLHFLAGRCLFAAGENHLADAIRHFQEGAEFEPQNEQLALQLKALAAAGDDQPAGTGFVVSSNERLVLTNCHVIEGPASVAVQFEGQDPMPAEVVAANSKLDLALLHVTPAPGQRFPRAVSFSRDEVRRGQEVSALGYPLGNPSIILTSGEVNGENAEGFLMVDCRVNPGNSGGPLCDDAGRVIGVVTAKSLNSAEVDSYGLALPVSVVQSFLATAPQGGKPLYSARKKTLKSEEVDQLIAPSVAKIIRNFSGKGRANAASRHQSGSFSDAGLER